nr:DNA cytosine methyltransferase [Gramella crocea]
MGEGFSSVPSKNRRKFDIRLSIEKDRIAAETLELRSFYRKFSPKRVPPEYYTMMMEADLERRSQLRKELFEKYPRQAAAAKKDAWCTTLGETSSKTVDERINKALKNEKNWVLIGGPPCQAYSLVGRSRRQWKENLDKSDIRVHLYKEYLRIIAAHSPAVFVMENVKGLLSSKVDGKKIFQMIKQDLQDPSIVFKDSKFRYKIYSLTSKPIDFENGYPVYEKDMDYLIKSEDYGVPQRRHRVILLGIREDIKVDPDILTPVGEGEMVNLEKVIGDLPKIRSGINRSFVRSEQITSNNKLKKKRYYKKEKDSDKTWQELINSFRNEIISWNGFAKNYSRQKISPPNHGIGSEFVAHETPGPDNPLHDWYKDPNLKGVTNHESRSHLVQDLKRYMFSSMFATTYERFPRLHEFEKHATELLPDHENAKSGKFADRFRVQLPDEPATTVTSHISKDGHYFIHYDPDQCRSLTVREAARIQTFPDNYLFCGSRTAQYHQVGNAVPPFLSKQIALIVLDLFKKMSKS